MEMCGGRERSNIPIAGVEVNGMAIFREPSGEIGNIRLAATASRHDFFVAESNVHELVPACRQGGEFLIVRVIAMSFD